jgi:aminodeoxyfutalosine deaminase
MSYRKFRADHLFTGHEWLNNEFVLVTGLQGEIVDVVQLSEAGEDIAFFSGILSPGFVNCHCHLELSHMKGVIPEKTGMVDFLIRVIQQRNFDVVAIKQAIDNAESSMLENGIVAVGDICNTADTLDVKKAGRLHYHNFIEAIGFSEATAPQRFEAALTVYDQFARLYRMPAECNSIVPHAPYSVSPRLFQLITRFAGNHLLTIHNQESEAENDFVEKGTGDFHRLFKALNIDISGYKPHAQRSIQSYLSHFLPTQRVIMAHNAYTGKEDLEFIVNTSRRGTGPTALFFCLCPNANEYIGNPLPDIDLLREYRAPITIGTDSLASNHQLSILAELNTIHRHYPHIVLSELLTWATINGARALELDNLLGSFEPGKQPGVLLINDEMSSVRRLI